MNGFTNAILSVLLGWLRTLLNAIWGWFGTEGGGSVTEFFRNNWKILFVVLCVGGFVIDRMIYFIRWRPDFVWRSKRRHKKERRLHREQPVQTQGASYLREDFQPIDDTAYAPPIARETFAQPMEDAYQNQQFAPTAFAPPVNARTIQDETAVFVPPAHAPMPQNAPSTFAPPAQGFAPMESLMDNGAFAPPTANPNGYFAPSDAAQPPMTFAPTMTYDAVRGMPPAPTEPLTEARFDEPVSWEHEGFNPAQDVQGTFGAAQPEPTAYLRDVQAGYAPPPPPEELYRRPEPRSIPPVESVHPGLDLETFQQNFGITEETLSAQHPLSPAASFPDFKPYSEPSDDQGGDAPKTGRWSSLAKRARTFVSGEDEQQPLTIRDLQATVDVKNAFHAPVYPKKNNESEDE